MGTPRNQRVLKARCGALFSLYLKALSFSWYNTVNKAEIPGQDSRPGGTLMHCVGHNKGCLVGHGPHSMGVHIGEGQGLLGLSQKAVKQTASALGTDH